MANITTLRSQEVFPPRDNDTGVTIIGAGAVGSKVASMLWELGLTRLTIYDHDTVEDHNINNQLFGDADVGHKKVYALATWMQRKTGEGWKEWSARAWPKLLGEKYVPGQPIEGTVFLLVDSLEARREIAESLRGNLDVDALIDVRMAAAHGSVFNVPIHAAGKLDAYLATIGSDEDAEVSACGSPYSVTMTSWILAGHAVWELVNQRTSPASCEERQDFNFRLSTHQVSKL